MSTLSMMSGVSGMKSNQTKLNVIGNNVANMGTTAYKRSEIRFEDNMYQNSKFASAPSGAIGGVNPSQVGSGVGIAGVVKHMSQGTLQPTNRPSDFAMDGDGFFLVEKNGEMAFTRDGSFSLDANGDLVNASGYRLIGEDDNPINIPTEALNTAGEMQKVLSYTVSQDGTVSLGLADGGLIEDHASLKIAQFQNPDGLVQLGGNLFQPSPNSGEPFYVDAHGSIIQGALEMSNVDIVDEFTSMMVASKGLQASAKVVTTSDQALDTVLGILR